MHGNREDWDPMSQFVTTYFLRIDDVSFELPGGNGRDSGIDGWENMGMGF